MKISEIATSTEPAAMVVRRAMGRNNACYASDIQRHTFWIIDVDGWVWEVNGQGVRRSPRSAADVRNDLYIAPETLEDALDWIGIHDQMPLPMPMPPVAEAKAAEQTQPAAVRWPQWFASNDDNTMVRVDSPTSGLFYIGHAVEAATQDTLDRCLSGQILEWPNEADARDVADLPAPGDAPPDCGEPPYLPDSEDLRMVREAIAGGCEGWRISLREFIDRQLETHKAGCLAKHGPCSAELLIRAGRATIAAILDDLEQLDKATSQPPVSST